MSKQIYIYNTLTRKKEEFTSIVPNAVGMYVCGPTVYGDPHLGHARPQITFDVLFRLFKKLGYKTRYVRNITDVGHLVDDADSGEDKIAKKAKLEQLEPMEVVQYYTDRYHLFMEKLNVLMPSIEPRASGHILEQIEMVDKIIENGFAYEAEGSIYFDIEAYSKKHNYGKLSGRILEDLYSNTRELDGQSEKRNPADFALWKKASPEHIMRWNSKWSAGFPGWHMECSAMSTKYLGEQFDIHGGGMDLMFPHHECEIAQSVAAQGKEAVRYWMHNNMITINGQKMGKALGNFINLEELFGGTHALLEQAYPPMVVRFFILQAHYRSPLDFSNEALQASEKGLERLMQAFNTLTKLKISTENTVDIESLENNCYDAICDDINTPILIAHLFEGVRIVNSVYNGSESINDVNYERLTQLFNSFILDILGLKQIENEMAGAKVLKEVVDLVLNLRMDAKANKDFQLSDKIRTGLTQIGFEIKDKKDGFEWEYKN